MTIKHPTPDRIPALKALWQEVFGDTEAFLDSFFNLAFSPERSLCFAEGDAVFGAVYWFDCTWNGKKVAYLYALQVAEAHRSRGLGRELMLEARRVLERRGYQGVCLVPGEAALTGWYEKLQYVSFGLPRQDAIPAEDPALPLTEVLAEDYCQERSRFVGNNAILQAEGCFTFLESCLQFWAGRDFLLCGTITEDTLYIQEYLGACRNLPGIACALKVQRAVFSQQGAMYFALDGDSTLPGYFGIPVA